MTDTPRKRLTRKESNLSVHSDESKLEKKDLIVPPRKLSETLPSSTFSPSSQIKSTPTFGNEKKKNTALSMWNVLDQN
jgi:hypothetical protein